jgi:magnesium transporter
MRVLTVVMALMAPATLIASIYGMNVPLPGGVEGNFLPLAAILLIMFGIAVVMLLFFRRRHWL